MTEFGIKERVDIVFELGVTGAVAVGVQHLPLAESFEDAVFEGRVGHVAGTKKKRRFSVTRKCRLEKRGERESNPRVTDLQSVALATWLPPQEQNNNRTHGATCVPWEA